MTFVFYDTETTGTDTSFDQILQFAAIRTDDDLIELDRFEIRCRLLPHVIPAPGALLATRVTPAVLTDSTLPSHYEAVCAIADQLKRWSPATFVGYNSIEFDEKLLRQAFYQSLKPIYLTNTGGNQRADILKLIDAAIVFDANSIAVPLSDKGRITRRLDRIAPANGFDHVNAHDAQADVEATIFMARLVRTRNPSLWDEVMASSAKNAAIDILRSNDALALVEAHYARHNVIPVTWCGQNPTYAAQIGVFDLRHDPADFIGLTTQQLTKAIKAPKSALRIVKANAQPILISLARAGRDAIKDLPSNSVIASRLRAIQSNKSFQSRVGEAISGRYPEAAPSPLIEKRIYDRFSTAGDMRLAAMFHEAPWEARRPMLDKLGDDRLRELGLRLLAFEAHHQLSADEQAQFHSWLRRRRLGPTTERSFRTIEHAISECLQDLGRASGEDINRLREIFSWLESMPGTPIEGPPNETQSSSGASRFSALESRTG